MGRNHSERFMKAPFSQHCKNGTNSLQDHFARTEEAPNEAASDNRTYQLCLWARANHAGVGYARSKALHAGWRRWSGNSDQRRPWVGPSRRSRPPLRLVSRPPLWLAASSPSVVISRPQKGLQWLAASFSLDVAIKDFLCSVAIADKLHSVEPSFSVANALSQYTAAEMPQCGEP